MKKTIAVIAAIAAFSVQLFAQQYDVVDKTIAVIGGEFIYLSDVESEAQSLRARGYSSDHNLRCEILETILQSKLLLMQARVDSLNVNQEMVTAQVSERINEVRSALGGDDNVEEYFGKSTYKLRQEWTKQMEEMSLTQQEQQEIAKKIPEVTPYDIREFLDTVDANRLPVIPTKYLMSQICVYPDREKAKMEAKEKLLELRERIVAGEKFSTLARLYSDDTETAKRGGELGMASKTIFWPEFSDAAMALKPGMVSNIVETPDGFHIIEVLQKKGDMFNARHILIQPKYTSEDREKGFARLDSLKAVIDTTAVTFEFVAKLYSEDLATRTNGGQMASPETGSAYFEQDKIKPVEFNAIKNLQPGEISEPFQSTDNEGRGNLVYKIIRLDKIYPSHTANFETDYNDLYDIVVNTKQSQAIDNWITNRIKETHIVIDPMFSDCDFTRKEWSEKIRGKQ